MRLPFKKIHSDAALPTYRLAGAAEMDLYAFVGVDLHPGEQTRVVTGFSVAIPEGFELQCRPRSGLAAKHGNGLFGAVARGFCLFRSSHEQ